MIIFQEKNCLLENIEAKGEYDAAVGYIESCNLTFSSSLQIMWNRQGIYETVLLMQLAKRSVGLHLTDDIVHHLQEILLSLLHEDTNFTMSKWSVQ